MHASLCILSHRWPTGIPGLPPHHILCIQRFQCLSVHLNVVLWDVPPLFPTGTDLPPSLSLPPFHLADCFPLVPTKLVQHICSLEFVEMRDLLPDNIALAKRLEALPTCPDIRSTEQREISSLLTWVSCFSTYIAVLAESNLGRVVDLLVYMRIIIREAHKHGGHGWMTYDTVFRRNRHKPPCHGMHWTCLYTLPTSLVRPPQPASPAGIATRQIITRTRVRWLPCYPPDRLPPAVPQPRLVTAPLGNAPYWPHPEMRVLQLPNPNTGSASRGTRGSAPFQERAPTSIYAPSAVPPSSQQETVPKRLRTVHTRQPPMRASP